MMILVTNPNFMQRYHSNKSKFDPNTAPQILVLAAPARVGVCTRCTAPALRLCRLELRRLCPEAARRVRGTWGLLRRQQTRPVSTNSPENMSYQLPTAEERDPKIRPGRLPRFWY